MFDFEPREGLDTYLVSLDRVTATRVEVGEGRSDGRYCITGVFEERIIKLEEIDRDGDARLIGCCWEEAPFDENLRERLAGACGYINDILICNGRLMSW